MKRYLILAMLLTFCAFVGSEAASEEKIYTVRRVIDGDTLKLSNGEIVRLIGIDCPENEYSEAEAAYLNRGKKWERGPDSLKQAKEATEFVQSLIKPGQTVRVEFDVERKDEYGRILAYAFIWYPPTVDLDLPMQYHVITHDDGAVSIFINATIIKAGYAQPLAPSEAEGITIPPNVKYAELFQKLYEEAREQKRGLWKDFDIADWRQGDGICKVHKVKMKTVVVNGLAGVIDFQPKYYEAKEKLFPNAGIEYPPELYSEQQGMIYVCPQCKQAKEGWVRGE